ncbi:MAG: hypothetical protein WC882_03745 [Candidatus Gracilibacteria bacterium]
MRNTCSQEDEALNPEGETCSYHATGLLTWMPNFQGTGKMQENKDWNS